MTATLLLAGVLLSQSALLTQSPLDGITKGDAAYEAMAGGRTDDAITQLRVGTGDDPAKLINLGTAYARKGMRGEAMACFEAAMKSDDRVTLQLADGRWIDSRVAARMAAARLDRIGTLAAR